jgi:hypothetical protein
LLYLIQWLSFIKVSFGTYSPVEYKKGNFDLIVAINIPVMKAAKVAARLLFCKTGAAQ